MELEGAGVVLSLKFIFIATCFGTLTNLRHKPGLKLGTCSVFLVLLFFLELGTWKEPEEDLKAK